jgi:hypothetical protein
MSLPAAHAAFARIARRRKFLRIQHSTFARRSFIVVPESDGEPVARQGIDEDGIRDLLCGAFVRSAGDLPYGSREYRLYVPNTSPRDPVGSSRAVAVLRAHRNILFGAVITTATAVALETPGKRSSAVSPGSTIVADVPSRFGSPSPPVGPLPLAASTMPLLPLFDPLVKAALVDAGSQGEQPQALATLHGLCGWVEACLRASSENESDRPPSGGDAHSRVLNHLMEQLRGDQDRRIELEAVRAIATGVPRSPPSGRVESSEHPASSWHGTYRDGSRAWSDLALEYAPKAAEVRLYRRHGAEVTGIELLLPGGGGGPSSSGVDDPYRRSAGGAMARMFFL